MTAMQALWRARQAWERTQMQMVMWPLEEAPAPQLTGVRGRAAGVSSSGPTLLATPSPTPRGRSTNPHIYDGGDTATLGRGGAVSPRKG